MVFAPGYAIRDMQKKRRGTSALDPPHNGAPPTAHRTLEGIIYLLTAGVVIWVDYRTPAQAHASCSLSSASYLQNNVRDAIPSCGSSSVKSRLQDGENAYLGRSILLACAHAHSFLIPGVLLFYMTRAAALISALCSLHSSEQAQASCSLSSVSYCKII